MNHFQSAIDTASRSGWHLIALLAARDWKAAYPNDEAEADKAIDEACAAMGKPRSGFAGVLGEA